MAVAHGALSPPTPHSRSYSPSPPSLLLMVHMGWPEFVMVHILSLIPVHAPRLNQSLRCSIMSLDGEVQGTLDGLYLNS